MHRRLLALLALLAATGCALPPAPGSRADGAVCDACVDVPAPTDTPDAAVDVTTDVQTADVQTADVQTADVPTTDVPTTDVPTADVPTADVPTTDVQTTDVPTADVPTADVPTADVPTADVPTADVQTTDVQTTDVQTTDVQCASGLARCGGGCVDLQTDALHCAGCGRACAAGQACAAGSCAPVSAPRPVAPLSTSTVTSQRPTLRWALGADAVGARVQICADRACVTVQQTLDATGTFTTPTAALARGVHFWRLVGRSATGVYGTALSPTWEFFVGARSAAVDTSGGTALDVNGDGYADVAVGASGADTVSVYLGGPAGVAATPQRVVVGATAGDFFGYQIASAGDVNGDGYADLLVGAERASPGGRALAGAAYVYHGGPAGLAGTYALAIEGSEPGERYGGSVSSAGDVNRDGYADIVVGAWGANAGAAYVYLGSPAGAVATRVRALEGAASGDALGRSVAGAGDVNGDGYSDIVVGSAGASPGGRTHAGIAQVFLGGASGIATAPHRTFEGNLVDESLGFSVAIAGDVNGDGCADIIVGTPFADPGGRNNAGAARVYLGGTAGVALDPHRTLEGGVAGDAFAFASAGAGDLNDDGYSDIVFGAETADPGARTSAGAAYAFLGGPGGVAQTPQRVLEGAASLDLFGTSVAGLGDVNGDGYADLAVGAPSANPGGRANAGTVSVYLGAASGVSAAAHRVIEGVIAGANAGRSVASRARPRAPRDAARERSGVVTRRLRAPQESLSARGFARPPAAPTRGPTPAWAAACSAAACRRS